MAIATVVGREKVVMATKAALIVPQLVTLDSW